MHAQITYIPIEEINVPPHRHRREFDPDRLAELVASIEDVGLLHPIITRAGLILAAGERRLRAIRILQAQGRSIRCGGFNVPAGYVPTLDIGHLSVEAAQRVELDENIVRVDLTWQERTAAIAMRFEIEPLDSEGWKKSFAEVGEIIDPESPSMANGTAVKEAVLLQRAMATNPEIAKAKTQNEAWKLLKRSDEATANILLAGTVGKMSTSERHTVVNDDCLVWLPACAEQTFDCVLIDPPYGMDADAFGDAAGRLQGITHDYEDSEGHFRRTLADVLPHLYRVSKAEAHLYLWCDIDQFGWLKALAASVGYWVFRTPLINLKREGGRVPWPSHGPRRCFELVLYAVKGKRPCTAIYRDVFDSTLERDTGGHGAIKPVEAYVELLKRTCRPGDVVLDCFAGTGTIITAAAALNLRSVAVERDLASYGQCLKRLEALG